MLTCMENVARNSFILYIAVIPSQEVIQYEYVLLDSKPPLNDVFRDETEDTKCQNEEQDKGAEFARV